MMNKYIEDVYPTKGQFIKNDIVGITIEFSENIDKKKNISIGIDIYFLEKIVYEASYQLIELIRLDFKHVLMLSKFDIGGYGVLAFAKDNEGNTQFMTTAFDVADNLKVVPRYGFLSDFREEDAIDSKDICSMTKLHINLVQYYDWMYRHEKLVSEIPLYKDLMKKDIAKDTVREKIKLCKIHGMKSIAYGAVYAASGEFYETHKDWGCYDSANNPISFINLFYIMNIKKNCGWHKHIIDEYKLALSEMNFDGIHMDTYGFPKTFYDINHEYVEMDKELPVLINDTKTALDEISENNIVIFNNVGNWPVYATSLTKQDILYVEVWEPYVTYTHIQRIISEASVFIDKSIIISAYLRPFINEDRVGAGNALKLITACIFANGATHLVMGEHQKILTQGYYVDNYTIDDELFAEIRLYYDLLVRYSSIIFDKTLKDVSMTHAYGDNEEYKFENVPVSPCAEAEKVWTVIRENRNTKLISLINLVGNDNKWNEPKNKPVIQKNMKIMIQISNEPKGVYSVTPENPKMQAIPYEIIVGKRGKALHLNIERIDLWKLIFIKI